MPNYRIVADVIHEASGAHMEVEFVMDGFGFDPKPTEADVIESIMSDISIIPVHIIEV